MKDEPGELSTTMCLVEENFKINDWCGLFPYPNCFEETDAGYAQKFFRWLIDKKGYVEKKTLRSVSYDFRHLPNSSKCTV